MKVVALKPRVEPNVMDAQRPAQQKRMTVTKHKECSLKPAVKNAYHHLLALRVITQTLANQS